MKKTLFFAAALCQVCSAFAAQYTIQVSDFVFTPSALTVNIGDTIKWVWMSGSHTTTSTSIPTGAASWDGPVTSATVMYMYVPTVAGTYNYRCTPHASMGMTAAFTVNPPLEIPADVAPKPTLYPVPARDYVQLQMPAGTTAMLQVFNCSGNRVGSMQLTGTGSIPLHELPDGLYLIDVQAATWHYQWQLPVAH